MALRNYLYIPKSEVAVFEQTLRNTCAYLGCSVEDMLFVMECESEINPAAVNKQKNSVAGYDGYGNLVKKAGEPDSANKGIRCYYRATGLIQFMPKTAVGLGTSNGKLLQMTAIEQLYFVRKYYAPFKGKLGSVVRLYLATFFPAALPFAEVPEYVFETSKIKASTIAIQNEGINLIKDGKITMSEFSDYVKKKRARLRN